MMKAMLMFLAAVAVVIFVPVTTQAAIPDVAPSSSTVAVFNFSGTVDQSVTLQIGAFPASRKRFSFEIWFYPINPDGVLLWAGRDDLANFIYIALKDSRVLFRYGTQRVTYVRIRSNKAYAVNKWHKIYVEQGDTGGKLIVDNTETLTASITSYGFQQVNLERATFTLCPWKDTYPWQATDTSGTTDKFVGAVLRVQTDFVAYSWWETNIQSHGVFGVANSQQLFQGTPCYPNPCSGLPCFPVVVNDQLLYKCFDTKVSGNYMVSPAAGISDMSATTLANAVTIGPKMTESDVLTGPDLIEFMIETAQSTCGKMCLTTLPITTQTIPTINTDWSIIGSTAEPNIQTSGVDMELTDSPLHILSPNITASQGSNVGVAFSFKVSAPTSRVQVLVQTIDNEGQSTVLYGLNGVNASTDFTSVNFTAGNKVAQVEFIFLKASIEELSGSDSTNRRKKRQQQAASVTVTKSVISVNATQAVASDTVTKTAASGSGSQPAASGSGTQTDSSQSDAAKDMLDPSLVGKDYVQLANVIIFNDIRSILAPPPPLQLDFGLLKKFGQQLGVVTLAGLKKASAVAAVQLANLATNAKAGIQTLMTKMKSDGSPNGGNVYCMLVPVVVGLLVVWRRN